MGLSSLDDLVVAGSYLVGLSSALSILKAQKHRQRDTVRDHLRQTDSIQTMLDTLHARMADFPASSRKAAKKVVPTTLTSFLSSNNGPRRTSHTVNGVAKEHRLTVAKALFDTDTSRIGGAWKRSIEARAARLNVTNGSAVFTLPRSRYDTSLTGPAFLLALSDFAGLDIPGTADLLGHTCYCTGTKGTAVTTDHLHTCGKHGRWHIHNRLRDAMRRLVSQRGNGNISFVQNEPRGAKLFPDLTKPIGPDAEYRINGQRVLVDFSGIADTAPNYRPLWIAKLCTHTTQLKLSLAEALTAHAKFDERASLNPVDIRDRTKHNGTVGRLCAARNVPLTPCTFINSGGISRTFDRLLITAFGADDSMIPGEFGAFTFSTLQHCRNVLTATIANAHAEYVIRNMRTALQHRGKSEMRLAWWNGNADHPRLFPDPLTNAVRYTRRRVD